MKYRHVIQQVEPVNEDELEADLRFLYHSRSDTADLFVNEAMHVFRDHLNDMLSRYQEHLLDDMTRHLRGEMLNVIMRSKRVPTYTEPLDNAGVIVNMPDAKPDEGQDDDW